MSKFVFSLVLLFFIGNSYTQITAKINFDEIKNQIEDSTSIFYYPSLKSKLIDKDSTLNHKDYKYLYYGLVFQDYYHPYGSGNAKKEFLDFVKVGKYEKALEKGEVVLNENPVDLEVLLWMSISSLEVGDKKNKRAYAIQYFSFLDVIYSSGDGKSLESAFVVVSVDHEYLITADLGLTVVHQALIQDCDLLFFNKRKQKKVKGQKKIKELYFNVRMPLLSLSNSFKDADLPDPDQE